MLANIETKVWAALVGGAGGGVFVTFVLWLLGILFWHVPAAAASASASVAAVPEPIANVLLLAVPAISAAIAGYVAPHTSRPDLATALPSVLVSSASSTPPV